MMDSLPQTVGVVGADQHCVRQVSKVVCHSGTVF